jgi:membrane associated rhomboid family serine protease
MLIPLSTDAPVYHFPWVTIVLIAVNLSLFVAGVTPDNDAVAPYLLRFGHGLHPLQWLTANFVHDSLTTLLVNLLFIWTFGLVVEGKLGSWRFLLLYLAIAMLTCGLEQGLMQAFGRRQFLAATKGSFGTGSVTFGLLGVALVWAPKNEMNCALVLGRPVLFDMSILSLALVFVFVEALIAVASGFWVLSSVVHVAGALIGAAFGLALVKLGWVDCENWDLLAVIAGREGQPRRTAPDRPSDEEHRTHLQMQGREAIEHIGHLLGMGKVEGALALEQKMARTIPDWKLPEDKLLALIKELHRKAAWAESFPLMGRYLREFPERSTRMRLRLAELLINEADRPRLALDVLSKIPPGTLFADLERIRAQLEEQARLREPDVPTELDLGEDW